MENSLHELVSEVASEMEEDFDEKLVEGVEAIGSNNNETKGMLQNIANIATVAQLLWSVSIYLLAKYETEKNKDAVERAALKKYDKQTVTSTEKLTKLINAVVQKLAR